MNLNFTISELTHSDTAKQYGINNTPDLKATDNLLRLIVKVLQPLRDKLGKPMVITSGFRCAKLNTLVGGVANSQHTTGQAVDFVVNGMDVHTLFEFVRNSGIMYDQLIEEHSKGKTWVHISYALKNRRESLKYVNGKYIKCTQI